ncbi:hypothetical protein [Anaerostipes sp. MSJ-23]|uniref:hypothetical protein n=1 Tax=unclassified Anaerostipes TaxID=2635253 RepID=UPI001C0F5389|nr:hypothetical protein [Anaerostipes sp. MSJ-23]MBU5459016.1 hypothetical protein [Anaerostipes sp. MSJ-23]
MKIAKNVYITEILKPIQERILQKIKNKKSIPKIYCITLPLWKSAFLEIYEYAQLLSDFYESEDFTIVGIAASQEDAFVLLRRILDDLSECDMINKVATYFCGEDL